MDDVISMWIQTAGRCVRLKKKKKRQVCSYLKGCGRVDVNPSLSPMVSLVTR